jgi:hypothetical protein
MKFTLLFVLVLLVHCFSTPVAGEFVDRFVDTENNTASFPSHWAVAKPAADGQMSLAMSFLYCLWGKTNFWKCPYFQCSWDGVANFDYAKATVTGNRMIIPFMKRYSKQPMCFVSTETRTARLLMINPGNSYVEVFIFNSNGSNGSWFNTWIEIGCFGVMDELPLAPDELDT